MSTYSIDITHVRKFEVTVTLHGMWPDVSPHLPWFRHALRPERLTFTVLVDDGGKLSLSGDSLKVEGRRIRMDGSLGAGWSRTFWRNEEPQWFQYAARAMHEIAERDWPDPVLAVG
jgi:hypothetical protein